ncbi:MAG: triple tyrosine motif-containing protein [Ignavibacteria bacterium]
MSKNFTAIRNFKEGNTKSLSNNNVISLLKDSSGNIWAGTTGGLNRFDKTNKTFKRYTLKDGLPNDMIYKLLEDNEKNIWISTNFGLSKFDPKSETFKNYDARDGFQGNSYFHLCGLKLKSGELAFGGGNGFDIFNPEDLSDNQIKPNVVLTDFLLFNKTVPISENGSVLNKSISLEKEIGLSYKDSVFSFEFVSLDFTVPGKNLYAYKMTGFDKDWVYSGNNNQATYTNLDPGEYIFRVKGSNNDGIWNEEGVSLKIKIKPPFWKTLWFKGMGMMAVAGTAASFYNNKLKKIEKEQKAQTEFTKRLLEVQENDRKRISAELHDSIGSDLLISKNKLQMSLKNPEITESVGKNINEVSKIITDTLKDVREISYSLHPYQIERLGLSKAIQSISDRAAGSTGISFIFNSDKIDKLLKSDVEISLYRIVQECINNIIKHSKADSVIVNISRSENELSVLISDNGVGFSLAKVKSNSSGHGFGLKGISERIRLFNGKLEVNSSAENGTEVKITVPL